MLKPHLRPSDLSLSHERQLLADLMALPLNSPPLKEELECQSLAQLCAMTQSSYRELEARWLHFKGLEGNDLFQTAEDWALHYADRPQAEIWDLALPDEDPSPLPGARALFHESLETLVKKAQEHGGPILLSCPTGDRSYTAGLFLRDLGLKPIFCLKKILKAMALALGFISLMKAPRLEAQEYLSRSEILKTQGLKLYLGYRGARSLNLPLAKEPQSPAYLLEDAKGVIELARPKNPSTYTDACGEQVEGLSYQVPYRNKPGLSFLVSGKLPTKTYLQWIPAKAPSFPKPPDCLSKKPGFLLKEFRLYSSPKGFIYFAEYEKPNAREILIKEPRKDLSLGIEAVGYISEDLKLCYEYNSLERNTVFMPIDRSGVSTRSYQGALTIAQGKETWLIFESLDVESSGLTAILFPDNKWVDPAKFTELHTKGC